MKKGDQVDLGKNNDVASTTQQVSNELTASSSLHHVFMTMTEGGNQMTVSLIDTQTNA